jgi:hypothetical protein
LNESGATRPKKVILFLLLKKGTDKMAEKKEAGQNKKKGLIRRILDELDRKLERQARKSSCCGGPDKKRGPTCS